jgi:hypothetical protein
MSIVTEIYIHIITTESAITPPPITTTTTKYFATHKRDVL